MGKTHIALALKAARSRKRILFYTAEELINELVMTEVSNTIQPLLDSLSRLDLLIIDKLGYPPVSKQSAALFFKLISKRYEKTPIIITSNRPFEEWGKVFCDDVVTTAILDKILHHCYPFLVLGKSYQLKEIMKKSKAKDTKGELGFVKKTA